MPHGRLSLLGIPQSISVALQWAGAGTASTSSLRKNQAQLGARTQCPTPRTYLTLVWRRSSDGSAASQMIRPKLDAVAVRARGDGRRDGANDPQLRAH